MDFLRMRAEEEYEAAHSLDLHDELIEKKYLCNSSSSYGTVTVSIVDLIIASA